MSTSRTAPSLWASSGWASFLGILRSRLAAAAEAIARERRISRDFKYLRSLDDHVLQDIGISRADIEPFSRGVRSGHSATQRDNCSVITNPNSPKQADP